MASLKDFRSLKYIQMHINNYTLSYPRLSNTVWNLLVQYCSGASTFNTLVNVATASKVDIILQVTIIVRVPFFCNPCLFILWSCWWLSWWVMRAEICRSPGPNPCQQSVCLTRGGSGTKRVLCTKVTKSLIWFCNNHITFRTTLLLYSLLPR